MAFRVAQFNILGRWMAGSMWFHYAKDFLPPFYRGYQDWSSSAGFPRHLQWHSRGEGRYSRFDVLMAEIRELRADILCFCELDCFQEFRRALDALGYDAVFVKRPGRKDDGCGIFWRRGSFERSGEQMELVYRVPVSDRVAIAQPLRHLATGRKVLFVGTHLHWDQKAGHQLAEAEELLAFIRHAQGAASSASDDATSSGVVLCGDLNLLPNTDAYSVIGKRLCDAALPDGAEYSSGSFSSMKPDVYYYARPRESIGDYEAREEWHLIPGRSEVLDYIFYCPDSLELQSPVVLPNLEEAPPAKRRRGGSGREFWSFWSGGWDFAASPAPRFEESRHDPYWRPRRMRGQPQLGIPNRVHGSDHVPIVCTLRFKD
mmetsp:Transcript_63004/g.136800  ORF Transcript_63004/g.136800 Transcript_63004/m.136800 type:complete len:373 (-) Transcript_63004:13-1131(-)